MDEYYYLTNSINGRRLKEEYFPKIYVKYGYLYFEKGRFNLKVEALDKRVKIFNKFKDLSLSRSRYKKELIKSNELKPIFCIEVEELKKLLLILSKSENEKKDLNCNNYWITKIIHLIGACQDDYEVIKIDKYGILEIDSRIYIFFTLLYTKKFFQEFDRSYHPMSDSEYLEFGSNSNEILAIRNIIERIVLLYFFPNIFNHLMTGDFKIENINQDKKIYTKLIYLIGILISIILFLLLKNFYNG